MKTDSEPPEVVSGPSDEPDTAITTETPQDALHTSKGIASKSKKVAKGGIQTSESKSIWQSKTTLAVLVAALLIAAVMTVYLLSGSKGIDNMTTRKYDSPIPIQVVPFKLSYDRD